MSSDSNAIRRLNDNKLMRSRSEVVEFETALGEISGSPTQASLSELHLVLDDACEHPDVMYGVVHLLESFDAAEQIGALFEILPQLVVRAAGWAETLHCRILNDEAARAIYARCLPRYAAPTVAVAHEIVGGLAVGGDSELATAAHAVLVATNAGVPSR